jgi:hypothetical protein
MYKPQLDGLACELIPPSDRVAKDITEFKTATIRSCLIYGIFFLKAAHSRYDVPERYFW